MGKHQIIYTSCMRGINGVNDGQQIFSYDASFGDNASDEVKGLFTYQAPALEPGEVMTEALVENMPKAFIYQRLGNGTCAVALNTYLGRDYMGSAGRFGNHLSHVILCDAGEMTDYPCEFYGSETLRDHMEYAEVNSPERPQYLPEPALRKGFRIDPDSIIEFLSVDHRMDIFKKMFAAMLAFESARKRVVICDEPGNIVMWIAALHYALPLKIAITVNFTTYEFDPSLSVSQICGVVSKGSRYSADNASMHFTFDFFQNIFPDLEISGEFFDFIDMGLSLSYESLQAFHEFVSTRLFYEKADERYYSVYALYCLFCDGLENLSLESFRNAYQAANTFASDSLKGALIKNILDGREHILAADQTYSLEILRMLTVDMIRLQPQVQERIKGLIVEKAIRAFTSFGVSEAGFTGFYNELEALCGKARISIPRELMKETNRDKLLFSINNDNISWKWAFIIDLLCEYILSERVPASQLSMDFQIGRLLGSVIQSLMNLDADRGMLMIRKTMDHFSGEWKYLAEMALNIESILFDNRTSERLVTSIWQYYYQTVAKNHYSNRRNIYSFFMVYDRGEQVFGIYKQLLGKARNEDEMRTLFTEQLEYEGKKYYQLFCRDIFDCYYKTLKSKKDTDTETARRELLQTMIQKNVITLFVDELINSLIVEIPISSPSRENEKLITEVSQYYVKEGHRFTDRLLLLASGMLLGEVKSKRDLDGAIKMLNGLTFKERIDLRSLGRDTEEFLEWIVPAVFAACESANDLILSYDLFRFSKSSLSLFISLCGKAALKESKGDKEFFSIVAFLEFFFCIEGADKHDVGRTLSKLSKQKLDNLDTVVQLEFAGKPSYLPRWEEIRGIAASTNPLFGNLSSLFKRKNNPDE